MQRNHLLMAFAVVALNLIPAAAFAQGVIISAPEYTMTPAERAARDARYAKEAREEAARKAAIASREAFRAAEIKRLHDAQRAETLSSIEKMRADERAAAWARKLRARPPLKPCRSATPCAIPA